MSELGLYKYYLSIIMIRDYKNQILQLGQRTYLKKILLDYQKTDCKPAPTAIKIQHLTTATANYQPNKQFCICYWSVVAYLIYAMLDSRLNLVFAVSIYSHYTSKLNDSH